MGDYARGRLDLDDEDRLPWLEPAIDEEEERISPLRMLGLILLGLLLIGAVVAGIWWVNNRHGAGGAGELIAAPEGNYKIPANEADARKFEGEGDASFAASEGVARDGRIDPSRVPEAPITGTAPAPGNAKPSVAPKAGQSVSAPVTDGTAEKAAPASQAKAAGGTIQLGAYGSARREGCLGPLVQALRLSGAARHDGRGGAGRRRHRLPVARQCGRPGGNHLRPAQGRGRKLPGGELSGDACRRHRILCSDHHLRFDSVPCRR